MPLRSLHDAKVIPSGLELPAIGTVCRLAIAGTDALIGSDDSVACDAFCRPLAVGFPRGWPEVFKAHMQFHIHAPRCFAFLSKAYIFVYPIQTSTSLKGLIRKIKGKRCREVAAPTSAEDAAIAGSGVVLSRLGDDLASVVEI